MREAANKHRRHVEFEVGDLVWLKLQPYRQHSVAKPLSVKLSRRFYGPFEVLQRVGPVAYKLRLPERSRIHDVFHVSLLREFVAGEATVAHVPLPPDFVRNRPVVQPVAVVGSQVMWHDGKPREHVLVRWSDGPDSPSWEPVDIIRRRFPNLPLEVKEVVNGRGVDTSSPNPSDKDDEQQTEEVVLASAEEQGKSKSPEARTLRPRDRIKPPQKFANYVAK